MYRFFDADGTLLYVGITDNLPRRMQNHIDQKPWWGRVTNISTEFFPNRDAVLSAERDAIRAEKPRYNRAGMQRAGESLAVLNQAVRAYETAHNILVRAIVDAHLHGNVSANNIARALAGRTAGPGWNRNRVLAILAAARTHTAASRVLADIDPDSNVSVTVENDTVVKLYIDPDKPPSSGHARAIVTAFAAASLTLAVDDPTATLTTPGPHDQGLPIVRTKRPKPIQRDAHTNGDLGMTAP
ncbi:GIY-YIG nuclease family protein [Glycomyces rutgersensis]|uniref:GIY-YIG domain-containing protein n=1 Tax=Glycomyces rutgersensis TaxID=58115 RepID=A0ABN3GGE9_9ACTN